MGRSRATSAPTRIFDRHSSLHCTTRAISHLTIFLSRLCGLPSGPRSCSIAGTPHSFHLPHSFPRPHHHVPRHAHVSNTNHRSLRYTYDCASFRWKVRLRLLTRHMLKKAGTMFNRSERGKNRKGTDLACIFVHAGAGFHSRENEFHHLKACQE